MSFFMEPVIVYGHKSSADATAASHKLTNVSRVRCLGCHIYTANPDP